MYTNDDTIRLEKPEDYRGVENLLRESSVNLIRICLKRRNIGAFFDSLSRSMKIERPFS